MGGSSLYIFWFLHQTTTVMKNLTEWIGCISFDSYIKPQLLHCACRCHYVVYLLIPTSNHNHKMQVIHDYMLYIFWFLHQTTTTTSFAESSTWLYIFWFLHQTTTWRLPCRTMSSCISFDSYIKPQLRLTVLPQILRCIFFDSYIKPQPWQRDARRRCVVYLLIPTSNHNYSR